MPSTTQYVLPPSCWQTLSLAVHTMQISKVNAKQYHATNTTFMSCLNITDICIYDTYQHSAICNSAFILIGPHAGPHAQAT